MEKLNDIAIGEYIVKLYTADGMTFSELLNSLKPGFIPRGVLIEETVDGEMKTFGAKSVPYEEFLQNGNEITTGLGPCKYSLVGTYNGEYVSMSITDDVLGINTSSRDIEAENIVIKKKENEEEHSFRL